MILIDKKNEQGRKTRQSYLRKRSQKYPQKTMEKLLHSRMQEKKFQTSTKTCSVDALLHIVAIFINLAESSI